MPAKKRCRGPECRSAIMRIGGECPHCLTQFCNNHRLPESHACGKLKECREQAFESNRIKLESQTAIAPKLVS